MMITACLITVLLSCSDDPNINGKSIAPERIANFQSALEKAVFTALPTPLYEGSDHWGDTKKAVNGLKWTAGKPELQYGDKKHGTWRKYLVTLNQPAHQYLSVKVNNMQSRGNNTLTFQIVIRAEIEFDVQQQNWQAGIKLFDGAARGRVTVFLALTSESTLAIELSGNLIPIVKYRLKVVKAHAGYEDLTFTHLPGVGGSAAKFIGNWTVDAIQQLKPSLERKLIDKLTQKLVKAADTREIQASITGIERK